MTFTRRLTGLAALVVLAGLLAGIPVVLWWLAQPYLPTTVPDWEQIIAALTSRDNGSLIVVILFVAAWVAWLYLAIALLIEIWAAIRRVPAPQLPGFSLPQGVAQRLVAAAMLAFIAVPALAGTSHATPGTTTPQPAPITATVTAAPVANSDLTQTGEVTQETRQTVTHTVGPQDTLIGLAAQHLGDGDRYLEIFDDNQGMVQANGSRLTDPDLIVDGTALTIRLDTPTRASEASPAQTPSNPEILTHTVGPQDTLIGLATQYLGDAGRYLEIFDDNQGMVQANGSRLTDPDLIVDGTALTVHLDSPTVSEVVVDQPTTGAEPPAPSQPAAPIEQPAPAPPSATPTTATPTPSPVTASATPTVQATSETPRQQSQAVIHSAEDDSHADAVGIRTMFGVGALMASGVIGLIGSRRMLQRRQRHRGVPLAMPDRAAASVEHQLRVVDDPMAIAEVDVALRSLALHCRDTNTALPEIRIARLTGTALEIYLAEPTHLPSPWVGIAAGTLWSFQAGNIDDINQTELQEIPAPYPALVTLGQDLENAHIMVDLEAVGEVNVSGPREEAEEVLAAMAIELATSRWADDLTVTLVGAFPEMEDVLQTGRIRYLPTVGRLFEELHHRADNDRLAMKLEQADDLHHARISAVAPSTWFPEIMLLTQPLTALQQNQLEQLMNELPRVAIASVAITDKAGEWSIALNGRDQPAILNPMGLSIIPQRIAADAYQRVLEVVDIATNGQELQNEIPPTVIDSMLDDATAYLHRNETPPETQTTIDDFPATDTGDEAPHHGIAHTPDPAAPDDDGHAEETVGILTPAWEVAPLGDEEAPPVGPAVPLQTGPTDGQPYLQLLGPVELIGAEGAVESNRKARFTEYLAYLVLTDTVTASSIDDAIWPNRTKQNNSTTRDPATSRLRKWLGTTDGDQLRLDMNTFKVQDIGCDWFDFQKMTAGPIDDIPLEQLQAAVHLVRGAPFKGVSVRNYGWAEPIQQQMISRIVDVCYDLASRQLVDEDYLACEATLAKGIDIEPGDEQLWRMRILAAHARHNTAAVHEATNRLFAQLEAFDCNPEPATNEFLRHLNKGAAVTDLMEMI